MCLNSCNFSELLKLLIFVLNLFIKKFSLFIILISFIAKNEEFIFSINFFKLVTFNLPSLDRIGLTNNTKISDMRNVTKKIKRVILKLTNSKIINKPNKIIISVKRILI